MMTRRPPQSGVQRHSMDSNGSSSISSYSAPWPHASGPVPSHHRHRHHRPVSCTQLQTHSSWLNEDLTVEEVPHSENDNVAESTWQEEAHWLSFRNAVQSFAIQQQQQDRRRRQHGEPILDESDQTRSGHSRNFHVQPLIGESLSSSLDSSSMRQTPGRDQRRRRQRPSQGERSNVLEHHSWEVIGPQDDSAFGSGSTNNAAAPALQVDTTRETPTIVSTFSASMTPSTPLKGTTTTAAAPSSSSLLLSAPTPQPPIDGASNNLSISSMASDLAETKMRLALAQAERDELEFALIQSTSERSGLTNSNSRS